MTLFFDKDKLRKIVWKQIEKDASPGEQAGGSGHLSQVNCIIDNIETPVQSHDGWEISYRYTVSITTEFTIYPDNPPWENAYEKTIIVDENGDFIRESRSEIVSTNVVPFEPLESDICEKSEGINEDTVQKVIDLKTGKDITGEYISQRLGELETLAEDLIKNAVREVKANPNNSREIYKKTHWEIHERLGSGSIGPATAVASGLMEEKKLKLADSLEIKSENRII